MSDINNIFFEGQCKREQSQARLSSAGCSLSSIFYQLIQVAIGTRICLSHTPNAEEWGELYAMAKKQSLVGVCFAGVQRLQQQRQEPPEMLYLTWMGMAAKIQQRNEVVNRQCVELGKRLKAEGYSYCILKGQGVAALYSEHLRGLRQSGDIDVWVLNKSIPELVEYVKGLGVGYKATAAHVECQLFPDTDVELHAEPAFMRNFRTNRKLVQWFNSSKGSIVESGLGFNVTSIEFNLVYMMAHMYHHVLFEGLGLRQLMDYYFVLRAANKEDTDGFKFQEVTCTIESLGMLKFAKGIMWVIAHVFADNNLALSKELDEKVGRFLLSEIMEGGNFGHYDERDRNIHHGNALVRTFGYLKRNLKFFGLGPTEVLSSPLWSLWHWWWRKRKGYM